MFYFYAMRYFLEIGYNGTNYRGWQVQPNAITVQKVLNDCLSKVLRQPVSSIGSGRTDAGVHARQQFVHLDIEGELDPELHTYRFNRILPNDIAVYNIYAVPDTAHARYDALSRTYEYHLTLQKNPFLNGYSLLYYGDLDLDRMNAAAALLSDYEDFDSFCKAHSGSPHYKCQLLEAYWQQRGHMLVFTIKANRFLRGMVRLVVGTLLEVGAGKMTVDEFRQVIEARDCKAAGSSADADGLFLTKVEYPEGLLML